MWKLMVFAVVLLPQVICVENKYCELYCDFFTENVTHTVCERDYENCGPSLDCGDDFQVLHLDDEKRQFIQDLHNYFRNKVASGNETRNEQPSASNMMAMKYNKELESIAQCWANACNGNPLIHDRCRRTEEYEHVGQNLGFINSSVADFDLMKSIRLLVNLWYEEVEIFKSEWVNVTEDRGPDIVVGHYTQMVWADTSEIGCAVSYYTTNSSDSTWHHFLLVCNYGPGGNYLGLPLYDVGEPCSNCPNNLKSNEKYEALCGETEYFGEDNYSLLEENSDEEQILSDNDL
ncbi:venom allergen 5-like [Coccinella septempunctata]|uniref:venom allergen 5-like n=1 Tax=Coccinella septempunctata TaxID=41139 RepID=UPI001D0871C6|nr:venom allergen 5-like [Coccinella septempunctata]